jgi:hypothetical protein
MARGRDPAMGSRTLATRPEQRRRRTQPSGLPKDFALPRPPAPVANLCDAAGSEVAPDAVRALSGSGPPGCKGGGVRSDTPATRWRGNRDVRRYTSAGRHASTPVLTSASPGRAPPSAHQHGAHHRADDLGVAIGACPGPIALQRSGSTAHAARIAPLPRTSPATSPTPAKITDSATNSPITAPEMAVRARRSRISRWRSLARNRRLTRPMNPLSRITTQVPQLSRGESARIWDLSRANGRGPVTCRVTRRGCCAWSAGCGGCGVEAEDP